MHLADHSSFDGSRSLNLISFTIPAPTYFVPREPLFTHLFDDDKHPYCFSNRPLSLGNSPITTTLHLAQLLSKIPLTASSSPPPPPLLGQHCFFEGPRILSLLVSHEPWVSMNPCLLLVTSLPVCPLHKTHPAINHQLFTSPENPLHICHM